MIDKILKQLDAYMKYNKMEGTSIHKTLILAFNSGNFQNIYLDKKTYPVLREQIFKLMGEYQKYFYEKYKNHTFGKI